ncbi:MAG: hypothetical protein DME75_04255 [Verrucomicrobia bacterium]|nr:MAG: hypothetical protein DME75_04255 [Verrucomicrobiota bacterium]
MAFPKTAITIMPMQNLAKCLASIKQGLSNQPPKYNAKLSISAHRRSTWPMVRIRVSTRRRADTRALALK